MGKFLSKVASVYIKADSGALSNLLDQIDTKSAAQYINEEIAKLFEDFSAKNQDVFEALSENEQQKVLEEFYKDLIDRLL